MLDSARAKARRMVAQAENRCPLSDEQRRMLQEIVSEATARAARLPGRLRK